MIIDKNAQGEDVSVETLANGIVIRTLLRPNTAPANTYPLSVLAFRSRFTQAEKVAIYTAAKTVVDIQIWLDDLAAASSVDVTNPQTTAGVTALATAGLITTARAAEILA